MNWCAPATRLAIYLRDGFACVWCGAPVESDVILTLDHCIPRSKGGSNTPNNLVTACRRCNSARGARPMTIFATVVAEYIEADPADVMRRVRRSRERVLPRAEAKVLLDRRGTVAGAVSKLRGICPEVGVDTIGQPE